MTKNHYRERQFELDIEFERIVHKYYEFLRKKAESGEISNFKFIILLAKFCYKAGFNKGFETS